MRSSKHIQGEAGCGWKVQRNTESEAEDGGGWGDIKGKVNPQKLFDISHQRAMLTCLTLHFQRDVKSSA